MRKLRFGFLALLAGCSGAVDSNTSTYQQKLDAAEQRSRGVASDDPCEKHGWYGDGVCDSFCARQDNDCVTKPSDGTSVVCAQFIESKNGVCGRTANDPCRFQDPDCDAEVGGSGSTGGTVCAAVIEAPDSVCRRSPNDPCRGQDPDCVAPGGGAGSGGSASGGRSGVGSGGSASGGSLSGGSSNGGSATGGLVDCDARKITCQTLIAVESCPKDKVRSVTDHCYGECVRVDRCEPGTIPPPDGSGGSTGGAAGVDCDVSKVTCQTFAPVECPDGEVPSVSGSCYGACVALSMCAQPYDCLPRDFSVKPPPCPEGQVPSVVDGKYDRCVAKASCAPSACLAFIEQSDGECTRPYNDPCRGQDPDCSAY